MKKLVTFTLLVTLVSLPAFTVAASNIGLQAVGGRIGYIMPEGDIEDTIGLGLNADLGTLAENITLHGYLDYWGKSYKITNYEWNWSVISLAAIAKYHFNAGESQFKPYAGAGLGLNFNHWSSDYTGPDFGGIFNPDDFEASDTDTDLGIHLLGGAAYQLSEKMDGFAELKYTIAGNADYLGLWVGISYKLK